MEVDGDAPVTNGSADVPTAGDAATHESLGVAAAPARDELSATGSQQAEEGGGAEEPTGAAEAAPEPRLEREATAGLDLTPAVDDVLRAHVLFLQSTGAAGTLHAGQAQVAVRLL
jgi:hypothetical protein